MNEPNKSEQNDGEERVLILAPFGRDSTIAAGILAEAGLMARICGSLTDLLAQLGAGAGCILITQEAVEVGDIKPLLAWLDGQPAWSDLPIVIVTKHGGAPETSPRALELMEAIGNVTFLERPFRPERPQKSPASGSSARIYGGNRPRGATESCRSRTAAHSV